MTGLQQHASSSNRSRTSTSTHSVAPTVAYQGLPGAFSEEAAHLALSALARTVPFRDFVDVTRALTAGTVDLGIMPIENTVAGCVTESIDAILGAPALRVLGEVSLSVRHQLLGLPGSSLETLRSVESQPVALAQCAKWLAGHPHLAVVPRADTAGAALAVAVGADPSRGAVASARAGSRYGLVVLAPNIQDHALNTTRFWVVAASNAAFVGKHDQNGMARAVVLVTLPHEGRALTDALSAVSRAGVATSVLTVRPAPDLREGRFVIELSHERDDVLRETLETMKGMDSCPEVLGVFRADT